MRSLAAALLLLSAAPAFAQPVPTPGLAIAPGSTLLSINADGQSLRRPDLAMFSAGVVTQAKTAGDALTANAERMDAVVAALRRAGVAERDIQTAALSLQPQYYYPQPEPRPREPNVAPPEPQPPRIIGYEARNNVQVRVRDLDRMGRVIDALVAAGANQIDGPSFTLDRPEAALDEARVQAMQRARARAELYARAAGLSVRRIVSISEGGGYFPVMQAITVTGSRMGAPPPPPPSPVAPGELTLGVNLAVQFELAP